MSKCAVRLRVKPKGFFDFCDPDVLEQWYAQKRISKAQFNKAWKILMGYNLGDL